MRVISLFLLASAFAPVLLREELDSPYTPVSPLAKRNFLLYFISWKTTGNSAIWCKLNGTSVIGNTRPLPENQMSKRFRSLSGIRCVEKSGQYRGSTDQFCNFQVHLYSGSTEVVSQSWFKNVSDSNSYQILMLDLNTSVDQQQFESTGTGPGARGNHFRF